jgi:hypothetical protein
MAAVRQALQHSQLVFNRALEQCDADFRASLAAGARAAAPPAAWLRSNLDTPITGEAGRRSSRHTWLHKPQKPCMAGLTRRQMCLQGAPVVCSSACTNCYSLGTPRCLANQAR